MATVEGYGALQARLRDLSYHEPLGIDSVALVSRLLDEIAQAHTSSERLEAALDKAQRDAVTLSQQTLPLRKEIAHLTRENNSLHLEIIHQEEAISDREKACALQVQSLTDELKKLQFVNNQITQQSKLKEKESAKLQAQVERLMVFGGGGAAQQEGAANSSVRGTIEMRGSPLNRSRSGRKDSWDGQGSAVGQQERLKDAQIISEQREQLEDLTREHEMLIAEREEWREKLKKREAEIQRLSKLVVPGVSERPDASSQMLFGQHHRLESEAAQRAADLQLEQLSAQVDLLNDQVAKYEAKLKGATTQIRRNNNLAEKLQRAESVIEQYASEIKTLRAKSEVLEEDRIRSGSEVDNHRLSDPGQTPVAPNEDQLDALREQVKTLTAHKDRLEDALRAMHYDKVSYTNALTNANSHNRVLSSDLARAEAKLKELNDHQMKAQHSLGDAKATAGAHEREIDVLRQSLKQAEDTRAVESEKNASLHRELRAMDKVLAQREEEYRTLNHTLAMQKAEMDRLNRRIQALTEPIQGDSETADQGGKKVYLTQEIKWLEEERSELRHMKEELLLQVMNLEEELQQTKMSLQTTQLEKDKLLEKLEDADKLRTNFETMLESKKEECIALQTQLVSTKEKLRGLSDEHTQSQVLLQHADTTENDKIQLQNENLMLKRRLEELRDQNGSFSVRFENAEMHAKRIMEQLQRAQDELTVVNKTSASTQKEFAELQHQYENTMAELRNTRQTCNHYQTEYEKLSKEMQSQHQSLTSGQSALQTSQVFLNELKNEIRKQQSELTLQQNSLHQLQTRLDQEKLNHKNVQTQNTLLQDELLQTRETARARDIALKQLRDEIQAKDRLLTEKTESVENLKLLIEQMESSRDQLVFKMKQQQQQTQRQNQEVDDLHAKISSLEKELQEKGSEVASLKKLTRTLDSEKDVVHDQLDALTEKYHEIAQQNEELRHASHSGSTSLSGLQEQMGNLVNQLNESEEQSKSLQVTCARLTSEVDRLQHTKAMDEAEMNALSQDLENMTIENQALSEECTRLQFAHQTQNQSTSSLKQSVREVQRERDTLNIELDDLKHAYRALIQENEGMQKARAQIGDLHEELTAVNEALRKQQASLETQVEDLREKNLTLSTEGVTYRDQVSLLTEQLQSTEEQLHEAQSRRHELQEELDAQKHLSTEISAQRYGAQAQNAAVSQRIVQLEAKISGSKYEVKSLQDKLRAEQSQRRSLEDLVATLRQQLAANETMLVHMREQREAMADEIRSAHQRLMVPPDAMNMSELNHTPPSEKAFSSPDMSESRLRRSRASSVRSESHSVHHDSASQHDSGSPDSASSILPMRALEEAQRKCKELEDRLTHQDDTIQQLERSRSKFKRFAAKYEREIEQRDRMITELRSSNMSGSFASPEVRAPRSTRSRASSSSSSSSTRRQNMSTAVLTPSPVS